MKRLKLGAKVTPKTEYYSFDKRIIEAGVCGRITEVLQASYIVTYTGSGITYRENGIDHPVDGSWCYLDDQLTEVNVSRLEQLADRLRKLPEGKDDNAVVVGDLTVEPDDDQYFLDDKRCGGDCMHIKKEDLLDTIEVLIAAAEKWGLVE